MSYGIDLYTESGLSIVANSENVFLIDIIDVAAGSFSKNYTVLAGETLYAVPLFYDTGSVDDRHPYLTSVSVSGGTVSWNASAAPLIMAVSQIIVYKKGNTSSVPSVNTYGAEIISETGNMFMIAGGSPFTFHDVYTLTGYSGGQEIDTGIPSSARVLCFQNIVFSRGTYLYTFYQYVKNGTWHISTDYNTLTFDVFVFTDREVKDVRGSTSYGYEFYNEQGQVVVGNNSKMLRMYSTTVGTYPGSITMTDLVAVPQAVFGTHINRPNYPDYINSGGYFTALSELYQVNVYAKTLAISGTQLSGEYLGFPKSILYIKTGDYIQNYADDVASRAEEASKLL